MGAYALAGCLVSGVAVSLSLSTDNAGHCLLNRMINYALDRSGFCQLTIDSQSQTVKCGRRCRCERADATTPGSRRYQVLVLVPSIPTDNTVNTRTSHSSPRRGEFRPIQPSQANPVLFTLVHSVALNQSITSSHARSMQGAYGNEAYFQVSFWVWIRFGVMN